MYGLEKVKTYGFGFWWRRRDVDFCSVEEGVEGSGVIGVGGGIFGAEVAG